MAPLWGLSDGQRSPRCRVAGLLLGMVLLVLCCGLQRASGEGRHQQEGAASPKKRLFPYPQEAFEIPTNLNYDESIEDMYTHQRIPHPEISREDILHTPLVSPLGYQAYVGLQVSSYTTSGVYLSREQRSALASRESTLNIRRQVALEHREVFEEMIRGDSVDVPFHFTTPPDLYLRQQVENNSTIHQLFCDRFIALVSFDAAWPLNVHLFLSQVADFTYHCLYDREKEIVYNKSFYLITSEGEGHALSSFQSLDPQAEDAERRKEAGPVFLLEHPALVHWYTIHCNIRHPKVTALPKGFLFYHRSGKNFMPFDPARRYKEEYRNKKVTELLFQNLSLSAMFPKAASPESITFGHYSPLFLENALEVFTGGMVYAPGQWVELSSVNEKLRTVYLVLVPLNSKVLDGTRKMSLTSDVMVMTKKRVSHTQKSVEHIAFIPFTAALHHKLIQHPHGEASRELKVLVAPEVGGVKSSGALYEYLKAHPELSHMTSGAAGTEEYYAALNRFAFVACPLGESYDSSCIWEALAFGAIPLVEIPGVEDRLSLQHLLPVTGNRKEVPQWEDFVLGDVARLKEAAFLDVFDFLPVVLLAAVPDGITYEQLETWRGKIHRKGRDGLFHIQKLFLQTWITLFYPLSESHPKNERRKYQNAELWRVIFFAKKPWVKDATALERSSSTPLQAISGDDYFFTPPVARCPTSNLTPPFIISSVVDPIDLIATLEELWPDTETRETPVSFVGATSYGLVQKQTLPVPPNRMNKYDLPVIHHDPDIFLEYTAAFTRQDMMHLPTIYHLGLESLAGLRLTALAPSYVYVSPAEREALGRYYNKGTGTSSSRSQQRHRVGQYRSVVAADIKDEEDDVEIEALGREGRAPQEKDQHSASGKNDAEQRMLRWMEMVEDRFEETFLQREMQYYVEDYILQRTPEMYRSPANATAPLKSSPANTFFSRLIQGVASYVDPLSMQLMDQHFICERGMDYTFPNDFCDRFVQLLHLPDMPPLVISLHKMQVFQFMMRCLYYRPNDLVTAKRKFVIISTELDETPGKAFYFPGDLDPAPLSNEVNVMFLLNHPLLAHWYTTDGNIRHPKFTSLPIGAPFFHREGTSFPVLPVLEFDQTRFTNYTILKAFSVWHWRGHWNDFLSINTDVSTLPPSGDQDRIFDVTGNVSFVASPPGLGFECFRTYESLFFGAIPIMQYPVALEYTMHAAGTGPELDAGSPFNSRALLEPYRRLPVLFVHRVEDISPIRLERWGKEIHRRALRGDYELDRLFMQFWVDKIYGHTNDDE
eukprot:gene5783-4134_t